MQHLQKNVRYLKHRLKKILIDFKQILHKNILSIRKVVLMFEMLKDRPIEASHRKTPHMIKKHIK